MHQKVWDNNIPQENTWETTLCIFLGYLNTKACPSICSNANDLVKYLSQTHQILLKQTTICGLYPNSIWPFPAWLCTHLCEHLNSISLLQAVLQIVIFLPRKHVHVPMQFYFKKCSQWISIIHPKYKILCFYWMTMLMPAFTVLKLGVWVWTCTINLHMQLQYAI